MTASTGLTPRELEVLERLRDDDGSNAQIAHDLGISEQTVKNHVRSIFEKFGVQTRTAAVVHGLRLGQIALGTVEPRPDVDTALVEIAAARDVLDAALDRLAVAYLRASSSDAGAFPTIASDSDHLSRPADEGSPVAGMAGVAVTSTPSPNQQASA